MKELKNHIKLKQFKPVYLLYGEESFLIRKYCSELEKIIEPEAMLMNTDRFFDKDCSAESICDAASTMPFMSEKRLVIVQSSGLFAAGRKDDSEKVCDFLDQLPDTTLLVFAETNVDKRSRIYKKVAKIGHCAEFKTQSERDLCVWVEQMFKKQGKVISKSNATLFVRTVSHDMEIIAKETEKIISYIGDKNEVSAQDIDKLCVKSLEAQIFQMLEAFGHKNSQAALDIYNKLIRLKESPIMVIAMIARQLRLIFQSKLLLNQGLDSAAIAGRLAQRQFIISECLRQSKHFSNEKLQEALKQCLATDVNIKTGKINDVLAVELLIVDFCNSIS